MTFTGDDIAFRFPSKLTIFPQNSSDIIFALNLIGQSGISVTEPSISKYLSNKNKIRNTFMAHFHVESPHLEQKMKIRYA